MSKTEVNANQLEDSTKRRREVIDWLISLTLAESNEVAPTLKVAAPIEFAVACSDEITAITVGQGKTVFRATRAFNLTEIRASLTIASTAGLPTINVKKNGVTIFATKITIDVAEKTSKTALTPYVLTNAVTAFADDDEIQIDIDAAGTGAIGLKVSFIGTRI